MGATGQPDLEALPSPLVGAIPQICAPVASWRRGADGSVVRTVPAINSDVLVTGGPHPSSVDWLHHADCFGYAAPLESEDRAVEAVFRRCRYDSLCAAVAFREELAGQPLVTAADKEQQLLAWWCRRCWEDRRTKEAADAVKRSDDLLARGFTLSSWCRFRTTARRAGHQACSVSGGAPDVLRLWQQCRHARGWPWEAAAEAAVELDRRGHVADNETARQVLEACCGDPRCLGRVFESGGSEALSAVRQLADERLGSQQQQPRRKSQR